MKHLQTLIEDRTTGETICACCGMVIQERQLSRNTDRLIDNEDFKKKSQHSILSDTQHDYGLGSIADSSHKEAIFINKWQARLKVTSSKDSVLYNQFVELEKTTSDARIPKHVRDITYYLYRQVVKSGLKRSRHTRPFHLALLYLGYQIADVNISLKKFESMFITDDRRLFRRYYNLIKREFQIKTPDFTETTFKMINHIAQSLRCSKRETDLANLIYETAIKYGLASSKTPQSLSGTAVYMAMTEFEDTEIITDNFEDAAKISIETVIKTRRYFYKLMIPLNLKRKTRARHLDLHMRDIV